MNQKIIEHFSHVHPLFLLKNKDHKNDANICSGCEKPISGDPSFFCCNNCNYVLHKSCTQLPNKVKHPLHPQHPLTLLSAPPYSSGYICDVCRAVHHNGFVYHCPLCKYDLDIPCASTWPPNDGHSHAFIALNNSNPFVCYACGAEGGKGLACLCSICQIWVHSSCSELPQTVRLKCHNHPLSLTYSLHHVFGFREELITCRACEGTMSSSFGGYFCSACNFIKHLVCAEQQTEDSGIVTEDETHVSDYYGESSSYVGSDHDHDQDQTSLDIGFNLFCHEHLLTSMEELSLQYCADKLCEGCVQPINPPFFSCSQEDCGFVLHQSCADLPRTKQHRLHCHPLTLLPKAPPYDGVFRCDGCKMLRNGFVYRCDECQFDLDVVCGTLAEKIKHESHKHPLLLEKTSIPRECRGCHNLSKHVLVCDVCEDFAVDCRCAALPSKAWHVYDKHPLSLIISVEQCYNCGICKENSSPNQWFYYCFDCDFCAHPCCVFDNSSYRGVKFGGNFQYDAHSHPLALVEEVRDHPKCEACGEGCSGWTLECGQCKCYFHREGKCFWEQFEKSSKYLALSGTLRHKYAANVFAAIPNVTK